MQKTNELVVKYLQYIKSQNLSFDKDSLDVAINCLKDAFKYQTEESSLELQQLVEQANPTSKTPTSQFKDQGNAAMTEKKYDEADAFYTQAIEQSTRCNEALDQRCIYYANRAAARKNLNQIEKAIEDLKKAVELNPAYQKGWLRLASYYEEQGDKQQAIAILEEQNKVAPCQQIQDSLKRLGGQNSEKIDLNQFKNISKDELLQKYPMLGDALNDPAIQELLQKPSVQQKMQQMQQNPMAMLGMMQDPEIQPLMAGIMKNLGPSLQGMMGGMDFGSMFGQK